MRPKEHAPRRPVAEPLVGATPRIDVSTESRYLLIRRDRIPADPAAFQTTKSTLKAGDEIVVGDGLQRYRILDAVYSEMPPHSFNGVLLVEPVERGSGRPEMSFS
jgi:hypothetical protein